MIGEDDEDVDEDEDEDDDDDDDERTRTGHHAVLFAVEYQINHNAKISHFYHVLNSYEEGGPAAQGNQGVWPYYPRTLTMVGSI